MMFLVYGWFESLALVLVSLGLLGVRWRSARIFIASTALCSTVAIVRHLPLVVGTNTVVSILVLAVLLAWLFSISFTRSLVAAGCTLLLLFLLELPILFIINSVWPLNPEANPYMWYLSAIPYLSLLFAIAFVLRAKKITLLG